MQKYFDIFIFKTHQLDPMWLIVIILSLFIIIIILLIKNTEIKQIKTVSMEDFQFRKIMLDGKEQLVLFPPKGWEDVHLFLGQPISTEDFDSYPEPDPSTLTCYECPSRATCEFVDDLYNTNGDCLAMK